MSDLWAKLEGHTVNGVLPLRRYLGGSNHSVVFLTESAKLGRSELALKLVPAVPALAQLQMARWRASAALVHPHLIQIFEAGQCQIGERHFLYVVTDYADQNLAQLLERRALTEDEAREMLAADARVARVPARQEARAGAAEALERAGRGRSDQAGKRHDPTLQRDRTRGERSVGLYAARSARWGSHRCQ